MSNTKTVAGIEYNLDNYREETTKQSVENLIEISKRLEKHDIISVVEKDTGMAVFCSKKTDKVRKTPMGNFFVDTVDNFVNGIIDSLENWPRRAKEENIVIRKWPDVKFGHNEEVICVKEYHFPKTKEEELELYGEDWISSGDCYMGEDKYDPKSHLTVGKKYRIFEAWHTKQVYITNNKGLGFWYSEDLFEKC
ncbi:MAG TPA: hypothetical protein VLB82_06060 [Thermodesulfobacteriota bacterium]|nr:hypothetical protein [Thermodesulfobacteriota bacterium]